MTLPYSKERFDFTDFYVETYENTIKTDINFYEGKVSLTLEHPFYTISIPPFCVGQAKVGVFLKEFSTLLDEMLVKWDKETVQRLYDETMQALFPEETANYELGFYEIRGFLYCTIQFSEEGHKKAFGKGRNGSTTADESSFAFRPPLRVKFQTTDPAMKKFYEEQSKAPRRPRHPRRECTLKNFDFGDDTK